MKKFTLPLLMGLAACNVSPELVAPAPEVVAVTPPTGAAEVPLDTVVRAEFSLPGGGLDVGTLSQASVTLTEQGSGAPVAATKALEDGGRALVLTPEESLQPGTTYLFSITDTLVDEVGTPFEAFSSTFTTGDDTTGDESALPDDSEVASLSVTNPLGIPFDDRFVLHRIDNTGGNLCWPADNPDCDPDFEQWAELEVFDTATVQLENTGESPLELSLTLSSPGDFTLPGSESALTLAPGEAYELLVGFIHSGDKKGVVEGELELRSADGALSTVELVGIYQLRPEGNREVFLEGIIEAFGYTTELGADDRGGLSSAGPDAPLAGEEVRSDYWVQANANAPVVVTQIAAFHGCCEMGDVFEASYEDASSPFVAFRNARTDSQTIFPREQGETEVARAEFEPTDAFELRSAGYSTDPTRGVGNGNLGMRLWPARDRGGETIPDTYIAAQDFVASGDCFTTPLSNCDFNDNMYLIENVAPAN